MSGLAYKAMEISTNIIDCHYKLLITTCSNVFSHDEAVDGPRRRYWCVPNTHCQRYVTYLNAGLMSNTIEAVATFCPSAYQPTSYAPIYVECPTDVQWIRPPTRLNPKEAEWVRGRKRVVADALDTYLERLCLEDFDTPRYIRDLRRSDYAHVPTLGLAISGGGYRSGYTGSGAIRALDSRLEAANEQRVGGLLQSLTYLSGLSGGSWPVTSLTSHNFPTVDEIVQIWLSQPDGSSNSSSPGSSESIFEDIAAKLKAGFNVSASDYLGRNSAYQFLPGPHGGVNNTWSGIARLSNFVNHQMPLPMLQASELTDDDKEYFGLKVPYYNATSVWCASLSYDLRGFTDQMNSMR